MLTKEGWNTNEEECQRGWHTPQGGEGLYRNPKITGLCFFAHKGIFFLAVCLGDRGIFAGHWGTEGPGGILHVLVCTTGVCLAVHGPCKTCHRTPDLMAILLAGSGMEDFFLVAGCCLSFSFTHVSGDLAGVFRVPHFSTCCSLTRSCQF
ncbi:hypothetical protein B0T22DRAFT_281550 [Podospora appendiculata]|uniref:Uncharacterized protein n=1 Tax=Podospora appendiculata TaxID=314037 RepID=A0AAE0X0K8_9PEZI|nr:hypothetical protein B0T22DRAFT_281550 [Podospora appendiculata]